MRNEAPENAVKLGSACSGVGCIDLGLERAGFMPAWQIEISPRRRAILERHWPGVPRRRDLTEIEDYAADLEPVDLIAGGTPCQDLSVAGRGEGLDGDRSRLFFDFIRLADHFPAAWILWENVPGAFSRNEGRDFAVCLEGFTGFRPGVPPSGWRNTGFCVGPLRWCVWRVLDARFFGVPQNRRRVFVVAGPRARPAPEVLLEPDCCYRKTPPREAPGTHAACITGGSAQGSCRLDDSEELIVAFDPIQITNKENRRDLTPKSPPLNTSGEVGIVWYSRRGSMSPTLTAGVEDSQAGTSCDPGVCIVEPRGVRILSPVERERLQGLPDFWTATGAAGEKISWSARRRMTGDGAAVPVIEWIGRRILAAMD